MLRGARLLVAASLGALATGCTYAPAPNFGTLSPTAMDDYNFNQWDVDAVRRMVPQGPAFNDQLRVGYLELADEIGGYSDSKDKDHFLRKAVASAEGLAQVPNQVVQPDGMDYRSAGTDSDGALASGRARLMDAFGRDARKLAPLDSATAQVSWDCWFEGAEAGRANQVEQCRKAFEDAMGRVDAALAGEEQAYVVFFAWDDATITPVGRTALEQVAEAYHSGGSAKIVLAGHADRSGTDAYNMKLSEARARNAAAELVKMGVPQEAMDVTWYGETRPRVPTADGVREPQNRRVEFTLPE